MFGGLICCWTHSTIKQLIKLIDWVLFDLIYCVSVLSLEFWSRSVCLSVFLLTHSKQPFWRSWLSASSCDTSTWGAVWGWDWTHTQTHTTQSVKRTTFHVSWLNSSLLKTWRQRRRRCCRQEAANREPVGCKEDEASDNELTRSWSQYFIVHPWLAQLKHGWTAGTHTNTHALTRPQLEFV